MGFLNCVCSKVAGLSMIKLVLSFLNAFRIYELYIISKTKFTMRTKKGVRSWPIEQC